VRLRVAFGVRVAEMPLSGATLQNHLLTPTGKRGIDRGSVPQIVRGVGEENSNRSGFECKRFVRARSIQPRRQLAAERKSPVVLPSAR
jgi:hypothetical protein